LTGEQRKASRSKSIAIPSDNVRLGDRRVEGRRRRVERKKYGEEKGGRKYKLPIKRGQERGLDRGEMDG